MNFLRQAPYATPLGTPFQGLDALFRCTLTRPIQYDVLICWLHLVDSSCFFIVLEVHPVVFCRRRRLLLLLLFHTLLLPQIQCILLVLLAWLMPVLPQLLLYVYFDLSNFYCLLYQVPACFLLPSHNCLPPATRYEPLLLRSSFFLQLPTSTLTCYFIVSYSVPGPKLLPTKYCLLRSTATWS